MMMFFMWGEKYRENKTQLLVSQYYFNVSTAQLCSVTNGSNISCQILYTKSEEGTPFPPCSLGKKHGSSVHPGICSRGLQSCSIPFPHTILAKSCPTSLQPSNLGDLTHLAYKAGLTNHHACNQALSSDLFNKSF